MSSSALNHPRLSPILLPELEPGKPAELSAERSWEFFKFRGGEIADRDLTGLDVADCRFSNVTMRDTSLRGATIVDSIIDRLDAPVFSAAGLSLRDVEISDSRIASAELTDASLRSVRFSGCKLGYVNLRGAVATDLLFSDCTIEELDIGGAKLNRVHFERTQLGTLETRGATLTDVDLRDLSIRKINGIEGLKGATMSPMQVSDMAETLASMIGIHTRS
ncbi:pentapeptide repeat-containing protein [Humidisolicoccus flavus]|uniref:pentapeptide repeat-containing protein n=1 Tax=Humidisolicoccus flavus TaxID=3111414 RepID=UPI00325251CB